jgi:uncharacterized protein
VSENGIVASPQGSRPVKQPRDGFTVAKCGRCDALHFPPRLICPRCGSDQWIGEQLYEAVIEEATTLAHIAGADDQPARYLATARAARGLRLIVGLDTPLPEGTRVVLSDADGAPIARPAGLRVTRL